jgi:hypothetical protein
MIWPREPEEPSLLEAIAKERLAKIQQAGKGLAAAEVVCEFWILAGAMYFLF